MRIRMGSGFVAMSSAREGPPRSPATGAVACGLPAGDAAPAANPSLIPEAAEKASPPAPETPPATSMEPSRDGSSEDAGRAPQERAREQMEGAVAKNLEEWIVDEYAVPGKPAAHDHLTPVRSGAEKLVEFWQELDEVAAIGGGGIPAAAIRLADADSGRRLRGGWVGFKLRSR